MSPRRQSRARTVRLAQQRFSVEPLLALARVNQTELARVCGVSRRSVQRWIHEGGLPMSAADKAARALGLHPANIWLEWTEVA